MDTGMASIDHAVTHFVKALAPALGAVEVAIATQTIVVFLVIITFRLLGGLAHRIHARLVSLETVAKLDNASKATLATVLQPLGQILPVLGYLLGMQRAATGIDMIHDFCRANPGQFPPWASIFLGGAAELVDPLQGMLANLIAVVVVVSMTWTLLLLKGRWFNSFLIRMGVEGQADAESDLRRALLPINQLLTWLVIGASSLVSLRTLGLDPSPILALGSVSGIVVGFASQQLLLNLMAGVSIFVTRPFVVGDIVQVKNGPVVLAHGTISNISPLRTSFLDDSHRLVTLPNKILADAVITNFRKRKAPAKRSKSSTDVVLKHYMAIDFPLKPPEDVKRYEAHARRVINAILVRLSIVPNIDKDSIKAHIHGLSIDGKLMIKASALVAMPDPSVTPEAVSEDFYLAIYKSIHAVEAEVSPAPF